MTISIKFLSLVLLLFGACNREVKPDVRLQLDKKDAVYKKGEAITLRMAGKDKDQVEEILFLEGDQSPAVSESYRFSTDDRLLGKHQLRAVVKTAGQTDTLEAAYTLLAAETPSLLTYKLVNTYPHDPTAYTQGLEFSGDTLFESTGQYGKSSLRRVDYRTGEVLSIKNLERKYFGEGITLFNNRIYQLTWREKVGFVYNKSDFSLEKTFSFNHSAEGWGLCTDGKYFYKSDGTEKIWRLHPETLEEMDYIQIYTNTRAIESVNELEWVQGRIYANIYQRDALAVINPTDGAVEAVIDLSALKKQVTPSKDLDVLNGIAYHEQRGTFFVTGKNWDKMFEIEIATAENE